MDLELPVGSHEISWTVIDPCNNTTVCVETIEVENSKAPTLTAIGTATALGENGIVELWAEEVIINAAHPCTSDIQYLLSRIDEGIESAQASLILTCEDIGTQDIVAYAALRLSDGSLSYSSTIISVAIRDGEEVCGPTTNSNAGLISGIVFLEDGRLVPDVELSLQHSFTNELIRGDTTGMAGLYDLGEITEDAPHTAVSYTHLTLPTIYSV